MMRLLDTHTFPPPQPREPKGPEEKLARRRYAILSHTWGDNEVTFDDLNPKAPEFVSTRDAASLDKIRGAQCQAYKYGFNYIWIDTVCIDKSSSAELSEAINSMWRWYREAAVCFVYVSDVYPPARNTDNPWSPADGITAHPSYQKFRNSRWFRRGWTLQELIAPRPRILEFFDNQWNHLGSLRDLVEVISEITRIDPDIFEATLLETYSIAQRMSWAANRQTERPEDRAYSLLGLLNVNLDIRYGEGERAFIRLQEEIISQSADESIFAWGIPITQDEERRMQLGSHKTGELLARSPDAFANASTIISFHNSDSSYMMTNRGLTLTASIVNKTQILLSCRYLEDPTLAILLNIGPVVNSDDLDRHMVGVPPRKHRQAGYVEIKTPRPSSLDHRIWGRPNLSRLSLTKIAEMIPYRTFRGVTIARKRDYRSSPIQEWRLGIRQAGRLWVVFEHGRPPQHVRTDAHCVTSLGPPIDEPFSLFDSQPAPASDTSGLTFVIEAMQRVNAEEHRSFDLRLQHPTGYGLSLRVDTTSERKFAYLQMKPIPNSARLSKSKRLLTAQNPPAKDMLGKLSSIPPLMRVHIFDRKYTAIAVLQKEDLSGERPYVLRVAMIRTSPKIWRKYVLVPSMPRIFFVTKEVRETLIPVIMTTFLIVSIAIFIPWPASIILLVLIMVAAGIHICVHSPLFSSRRNR